jgi:hypothetical protein
VSYSRSAISVSPLNCPPKEFVKSFHYMMTMCGLVLGASLTGLAWSSEPVDTIKGAQAPTEKCSRCEGNGFLKCGQCKDGQFDCSGKCLKLSSGKWKHMDVPGHDPSELWQKFTGSRGTGAWTSAHVGEVIEIRKGMPENIGKCPMCEGKTRVSCKVCQGTGTIMCPVCRGNKVVSIRVTVPVRAAPSATINSFIG